MKRIVKKRIIGLIVLFLPLVVIIIDAIVRENVDFALGVVVGGLFMMSYLNAMEIS
jgi:hypothetical protein